MNDDMMQPTEPAQQPVSMHDTPHKHNGAWPLIAGMLGVFLVLETIAIGYGIKQMSVFKHKIDNAKTQISERVETAKEEIPPFVYSNDNKQLYIVDRITGKENLLYSSASDAARINVFAIPQVSYDGKIYVSRFCNDCDSPSFSVQEMNLLLPEQAPVPVDKWSFVRGSAEVSPDQTTVAIARYADVETGHSGKVVALNLITGDESIVGELGADEYFSQYFGENVFARAQDFSLNWVNNRCFDVYIYQDNPAESTAGEKTFKEVRNYCTE